MCGRHHRFMTSDTSVRRQLLVACVRLLACVGWVSHKAWRVCARAWWCVHATALRGVDVLSPWYLHPTRHIEVWGTKNRRPVLTYRVREARVMDVQVHSPSVRERHAPLPCTLHGVVAASADVLTPLAFCVP